MRRWRGRVALVTGASKGIGVAIARTLLSHGLHVVGCARDPAPIRALAEELQQELQQDSRADTRGGNSAPGSLTALQCDLTQPAEIEAMFATIEQQLGGVDVCVNNAGFLPGPDNSLLGGDFATWQQTVHTNLLGTALCSQLFVRGLRARGAPEGHLINICSLTGHLVWPYAYLHFYTTTKQAVTALTEGLRQELLAVNAGGSSRIRVGQISPGLVDTGMVGRAQAADGNAASPGPEEVTRAWPPADLVGITPQDVADAVVYMMSTPPNVQVHDILLRPTDEQD